MTSLNKIFASLLPILLIGCTAAKSPLGDQGGATFAIIPEKTEAVAELGKATADSFGRPRTQRLHFTVCLMSLVTGEPVAVGTKFSITDLGGGEILRDATAGGCLKWDEEHAVQPMSPERNVRVERRVGAVSNHRGAVSLVFNVKPWLDGGAAVQSASNLERYEDAITSGTGLKFNEQYPVAIAPARAKNAEGRVGGTVAADDRPRLMLGDNHLDLNYVSNGRSPEFEVDRFLNLTMPYRFTFSLRPLIARRVFSGVRQTEPMTAGRLRLTLVFFASARGSFREDNRYLTSAQVEGEVEANGVFSGEIVVKYPHALFASGRQTVLARVSAPGQSAVDPGDFSGSLSFIDQQGAMLMLKDERDAEALHRAGVAQRQNVNDARSTPLAEFLAANDVTRFDVGAGPASDLFTGEELKDALDHDGLVATTNVPREPLAKRLCRAYLRSARPPTPRSLLQTFGEGLDAAAGAPSLAEMTEEHYCGKRQPLITVQQLDFTEELLNRSPRNVSIVTYRNQDFGLYYSRDEAKVFAKNFAFGLHAQAPELLGVFGDASLVWSRISTRSRRSTFAQSQTMTIDVGSLEVHARVRSCVLVSGTEKTWTAKPWLICQGEIRPAAWITEHFFYYSQIFGSHHSPFLDPFDGQSGVKLLVRGRFQMQHQSARMTAPDFAKTGFNVIVEGRQPDFAKFETEGRVDTLTTQAVPGAWLRN